MINKVVEKLESIKEALEEARKFRHEKYKKVLVIDIDYFDQCLDNIESILKRLKNFEKELKTLEIIKRIGFLELDYLMCVDYETYCKSRDNPISRDDYNLLREVLMDDYNHVCL